MDTDSTPATSTPDSTKGVTPEKYIRTFSSDMEIFQKGGTPGLAPLKTVSADPILPPPLPPSAPSSQPMPLSQVVSAPPPPTMILKSTPESKSESKPVPVAVRPQEKSESPAPLETYSEDFRIRVKETKASTATILAAEQDAPRPVGTVVEEPKRDGSNRWYIIAGIVLFCVSGIGLYIAYSQYLVAQVPVVVAPMRSTPIFVDSSEKISGTGLVLQQAIQQSTNKSLPANTVRLLSFTATSSTSVFSALSTTIPDILLRNINAGGSMAGIVSVTSGNAGTTQSPFFILSVGSYTATFSGMLSWEPVMQKSLAVLFPIYPSPVTVGSTTATSSSPLATTTVMQTATTSIASFKEGFHDEVVSNHDVRIYRDALGRSIMLYGYWNQATLVIAHDPAAFIELLGRLATSHAK